MMSRWHVIHARIGTELKLFCRNSLYRKSIFYIFDRDLTLKWSGAAGVKLADSPARTVASAAVCFFGFENALRDVLAIAVRCFVCGSPGAPFGFGWPGPRSQKPTSKRGYLRTCADHRAAGEQRRRDAITKANGQAAPSERKTTPTGTKGKNS